MWPGTACGLAGPTLEMPVTSQRAGRLLLWPAVLVGMLLVQPGGPGVGRCGGQWRASCWAGSCNLDDGIVRHKLLGVASHRLV